VRREAYMHRAPKFLMDQMCSGSGLYPVRLLDDSWLLPEEQQMVIRLEQELSQTGRAHELAWDMLTPLVYNVDVKVVLDNSGSMQLDMFGQQAYNGGYAQSWIDSTGMENQLLMRQLFAQRRGFMSGAQPSTAAAPLSPFHRRWYFARDAMRRWGAVFNILGIDPPMYLLNRTAAVSYSRGGKLRCSQMEQVFAQPPGGGTPMTEAIASALADHLEAARTPQGTVDPHKPCLILVITDGEANDMISFNNLLDSIQNGVYGDVQVCLLGLSLVPKDIEWFENEECDETRIRTIEAYEVEAQQIRYREVVKREDGYNFYMHSYRSLVTNYFPADYDYEAPLQNFRHRLYITMHGRDRWWGLNNFFWKCACSYGFCTCCFLATGGHLCGFCQGNDCGKCQKPEALEGCCEGEG